MSSLRRSTSWGDHVSWAHEWETGQCREGEKIGQAVILEGYAAVRVWTNGCEKAMGIERVGSGESCDVLHSEIICTDWDAKLQH